MLQCPDTYMDSDNTVSCLHQNIKKKRNGGGVGSESRAVVRLIETDLADWAKGNHQRRRLEPTAQKTKRPDASGKQ